MESIIVDAIEANIVDISQQKQCTITESGINLTFTSLVTVPTHFPTVRMEIHGIEVDSYEELAKKLDEHRHKLYVYFTADKDSIIIHL